MNDKINNTISLKSLLQNLKINKTDSNTINNIDILNQKEGPKINNNNSKTTEIFDLSNIGFTSSYNSPITINFFEQYYNPNTNTYGVDQSLIANNVTYKLGDDIYSYHGAKEEVMKNMMSKKPIPSFEEITNEKYIKLQQSLINKGFSENDASIVLHSIDDRGACSYASTCSAIFYHFKDCPELFKETFGYDMYINNDNGNLELNSVDLLIDLFLFANDTANGGKMFNGNTINYSNTNIDPMGRQLPKGDDLYKFSNHKNDFMLYNFLKSKNENIHLTTTELGSTRNSSVVNEKITDSDELKKIITNELVDGRSLRIAIETSFKNKAVIHDYESDELTTLESHSMFVTGIENNKIIVSSWGRKYYILLEELIKCGDGFTINNFNILSSKISFN